MEPLKSLIDVASQDWFKAAFERQAWAAVI